MPKKQFDLPDEMDTGENIPGLADSFADIVEGTTSRTTLLQRRSDGNLVLHNFVLTPVGFQPANDDLPALHNITQDTWQQIGSTLFEIETSLQWAIGDWLAAGERASYGSAKQLAEAMGRRPALFHQWAFVARKVEFLLRNKNLSWAHHQVVAKMCDRHEIEEWLDYADSERLSTRELKEAIKNAKETEKSKTATSPSLAATHTWVNVEKALAEQSDPDQQAAYLDALRAMIDQRLEVLRPNRPQLRDNQIRVLLRLYQKGPIKDTYHTNHMRVCRELAELGLVKIDHEGTRYTAYIIRRGEQHLRQIGEIA